MKDLKEICRNLEEYIELFIKILHDDTPIIRGCSGNGVRRIICYLNWYQEHVNDWPESMRISEDEYDKIIHCISIALDNIPEDIIKNINYETCCYYNVDSFSSLFIAELYVFQATEKCENTDRSKYMIEQYAARQKS